MPFPTYGGSPVLPANVSYKAYTIAASVELAWPSGLEDSDYPVAFYVDITASSAGLSVTMPPADQVGVGMAVIFNNPAMETYTVRDNDGVALFQVLSGESKYLILRDSSSNAGLWRYLQFGAGTSGADASALAGRGILSLSNVLNWGPNTLNIAATYTLSTGDRAAMVIYTGGAGDLDLPTVASAGDRFVFMVNNAGSGILTLDPSGAELIDEASSITLNPGESCLVMCDGTAWYTVGRGRTAVFAVTTLTKSIAGGPGTVTLSTGEAAAQIQQYTGVLTGNQRIEFGTSPNFYYIDNSTSGAFTATYAGGGADPGVVVTQGTKAILVNNNGTMYNAVTLTSGTVTNIATGTGLTGGPITATGTISIAATGVVAGNYGQAGLIPVLAVNAQGQITSASEVNALPAGTILPFGGAAAPTGYLLCDGSAVSRTTYAALFTAIGTAWGPGNGTTTFNVPDLRGRGLFFKDDMGGSAANRITTAGSGVDGLTLGAVGGNQLVQTHTHVVTDPGHQHNWYYNSIGTGGVTPFNVMATGSSSGPSGGNEIIANTTGISNQNYGSGSSQNMPPAAIATAIIKT